MKINLSQVGAVVSAAAHWRLWCAAALGQDRESRPETMPCWSSMGSSARSSVVRGRTGSTTLSQIEVKRTQADRVPANCRPASRFPRRRHRLRARIPAPGQWPGPGHRGSESARGRLLARSFRPSGLRCVRTSTPGPRRLGRGRKQLVRASRPTCSRRQTPRDSPAAAPETAPATPPAARPETRRLAANRPWRHLASRARA